MPHPLPSSINSLGVVGIGFAYGISHLNNFLIPRNEKKYKSVGSMLEFEQLHTNPSPNLTLTLACYQLIFVGLGEG